MSDDSPKKCEECDFEMKKQISCGYLAQSYHTKPSVDDHKQSEHTKKVKDPERAVKMRKKAFGHDAVGDPAMQTDPRHIVKRGRVLGGAQKEIDKQEFIKAAAKDDYTVAKAQEAIKKSKTDKKP